MTKKQYIKAREARAIQRQGELKAKIERYVTDFDVSALFFAIKKMPDDKAIRVLEDFVDLNQYYAIENLCVTLGKM